MGVQNWSVVNFGRSPNHTVPGSSFSDSGAFTSSGTAANITGLILNSGELLEITSSVNAWINFGGTAAAVGTGRFIAAGVTYHFQVSEGDAGVVSVIDE